MTQARPRARSGSRLSPFRADASRKEKLYIVSILSWVFITVAGWLHFWMRGVNFGPEPDIVAISAAAAFLVGFMSWIPIYRDRHPLNPVAGRSFAVRWGVWLSMILALSALAWGTFQHVLGPLATTWFGTPSSAEYIVTEKSSGRADRRSCNHFVWLRGEGSWRQKICLSEETWARIEVQDVLLGEGRRSTLGRTIEKLEVKD